MIKKQKYVRTKESLADDARVVEQWLQDPESLTQVEQLNLTRMVRDICVTRYNNHFKRGDDWYESKLMREELPMVLLDYLRKPRTQYTYTTSLATGKVKRVKVHTAKPIYHTLGYRLFEFRMQFPRIISVLNAKYVGIVELQDIGCYYSQVASSLGQDIHKSLVFIRKELVGKELYREAIYDLAPSIHRHLYEHMTDDRYWMMMNKYKEDRANGVVTKKLLATNASCAIVMYRHNVRNQYIERRTNVNATYLLD